MQERFKIKVLGEDSASEDYVVSELLKQLPEQNVEVHPATEDGKRDGGALLLTLGLLGGAASIATVVSTIHSISAEKSVKIIILNADGSQVDLDQIGDEASMKAAIEKATEFATEI